MMSGVSVLFVIYLKSRQLIPGGLLPSRTLSWFLNSSWGKGWEAKLAEGYPRPELFEHCKDI